MRTPVVRAGRALINNKRRKRMLWLRRAAASMGNPLRATVATAAELLSKFSTLLRVVVVDRTEEGRRRATRRRRRWAIATAIVLIIPSGLFAWLWVWALHAVSFRPFLLILQCTSGRRPLPCAKKESPSPAGAILYCRRDRTNYFRNGRARVRASGPRPTHRRSVPPVIWVGMPVTRGTKARSSIHRLDVGVLGEL